MPKLHYTPGEKEKVEIVLKALLSFANSQNTYYANFDFLEVKWEDKSNVLQVKESLKDIQTLVNEHDQRYNLTENDVRLVRSYLNDLEIRTGKNQGKKKLNYRLALWSREKNTNLRKLSELWGQKKDKRTSREENNTVPFIRHLENALNNWKGSKNKDKGVIYSAPASAFFAGEHSVVFGHPAIYYPIPLRLYIYLEPINTPDIVIKEYIVPDPQNINCITNIRNLDSYGDPNISDFEEKIRSLFFYIHSFFLRKKLVLK